MQKRPDLLRVLVRVLVFIVAFYALGFVLDSLLRWAFGGLAGPTLAVLGSAFFATWLALRIYEDLPVTSVGLTWSRASFDNLLLGLAAGAGVACLALLPPLLVGAAHIEWRHAAAPDGIAFAILCLAAGSVGEEVFFRGYGFQTLISRLGAWPSIMLIGALFGVMHSANPDASTFGIVNTAGFGILFGYAYLRSRDLWLPVGLHFGWNITLPAFGANLSGIKIFKEITGHEMVWRTGSLWSGGQYGPEASLLVSLAFIPMFVFLWKAPIRRQSSQLIDRLEGASCEPSSSSQ
jgi:membrane protease YdiL (CAAX protease family)